jgi:hypothetical protein
VPANSEIVSVRDHYVEDVHRFLTATPSMTMTLDWKGRKYVVRYESYSGYYPRSWAGGKEIQVKRERGRFIISRGEEGVPAPEVNPNDCVDTSFPGAGSTSSHVPCD